VDDALELNAGLEAMRAELVRQIDHVTITFKAFAAFQQTEIQAKAANFNEYPTLFTKMRSLLSFISFLPGSTR
jgi:hypothetical protein